jgi:replication factor C large subunit
VRTDSSWTEKYRPGDLDDLVGHIRPVAELRAWGRSWSSDRLPERRALIIEGDPGVGKTTAALALASEMGWDVVELNASDSRNMESIRMLATRGALSRDITDTDGYTGSEHHRLKMILLDEADNLFERSASSEDGTDVGDRGGKRAIVELVRMTKQPVVLIVNDLYGLTSGSGASLNQSCLKVRFRKVSGASIAKRLRFICSREKVACEEDLVIALSERADGDMRSAVSDLQLLCAGKTRIGLKDADVLGFRDVRGSIFETLDRVFKASSLKAAIKGMESVDEDIGSLILWMSENVEVAMSHPEDIDRAMQLLSKADIFLGRVRRNQDFGLWNYARKLMAALSLARKHPHAFKERYRFPSYLRSMSRTKESRGAMREATLRIGRVLHTSSRTVMDDPIWRLALLCERDHELASYLVAQADLENEHLKVLTGGRMKAADMDEIMEGAKALSALRSRPRGIEYDFQTEEDHDEEAAEEEPPTPEVKAAKEQEKGLRQSGLFDF